MSELTTPIKIEIPGVGTIESADLYLKSEANKVIAHQKYKRCLAMAEWCYGRWIRAYNSSRLQKARFYARWQKRWQELAEKFKEHI